MTNIGKDYIYCSSNNFKYICNNYEDFYGTFYTLKDDLNLESINIYRIRNNNNRYTYYCNNEKKTKKYILDKLKEKAHYLKI